MSQLHIDDDTLLAYIDGHLTDAERATVDHAVSDTPALYQRAALLREQQKDLQDTFSDELATFLKETDASVIGAALWENIRDRLEPPALAPITHQQHRPELKVQLIVGEDVNAAALPWEMLWATFHELNAEPDATKVQITTLSSAPDIVHYFGHGQGVPRHVRGSNWGWQDYGAVDHIRPATLAGASNHVPNLVILHACSFSEAWVREFEEDAKALIKHGVPSVVTVEPSNTADIAHINWYVKILYSALAHGLPLSKVLQAARGVHKAPKNSADMQIDNILVLYQRTNRGYRRSAFQRDSGPPGNTYHKKGQL